MHVLADIALLAQLPAFQHLLSQQRDIVGIGRDLLAPEERLEQLAMLFVLRTIHRLKVGQPLERRARWRREGEMSGV